MGLLESPDVVCVRGNKCSKDCSPLTKHSRTSLLSFLAVGALFLQTPPDQNPKVPSHSAMLVLDLGLLETCRGIVSKVTTELIYLSLIRRRSTCDIHGFHGLVPTERGGTDHIQAAEEATRCCELGIGSRLKCCTLRAPRHLSANILHHRHTTRLVLHHPSGKRGRSHARGIFRGQSSSVLSASASLVTHLVGTTARPLFGLGL